MEAAIWTNTVSLPCPPTDGAFPVFFIVYTIDIFILFNLQNDTIVSLWWLYRFTGAKLFAIGSDYCDSMKCLYPVMSLPHSVMLRGCKSHETYQIWLCMT